MGACLQFNLRGAGKSESEQRELLRAANEIDICVKLGSFFGPEVSYTAQGRGTDVKVKAASIEAEVKYLGARPFHAWNSLQYKKDWERLTDLPPDQYDRFVFVIFWPSIKIKNRAHALGIGRPYAPEVRFRAVYIAPFACFMSGQDAGSKGSSQKLEYCAEAEVCRAAYIRLKDNVTLRFDLVGSREDLIWATIYSRVSKPTITDTMPVLDAVDEGVLLSSGGAAWTYMRASDSIA